MISFLILKYISFIIVLLLLVYVLCSCHGAHSSGVIMVMSHCAWLFNMGSGGRNLASYACMADNSLAESFPQPFIFILKDLVKSLH